MVDWFPFKVLGGMTLIGALGFGCNEGINELWQRGAQSDLDAISQVTAEHIETRDALLGQTIPLYAHDWEGQLRDITAGLFSLEQALEAQHDHIETLYRTKDAKSQVASTTQQLTRDAEAIGTRLAHMQDEHLVDAVVDSLLTDDAQFNQMLRGRAAGKQRSLVTPESRMSDMRSLRDSYNEAIAAQERFDEWQAGLDPELEEAFVKKRRYFDSDMLHSDYASATVEARMAEPDLLRIMATLDNLAARRDAVIALADSVESEATGPQSYERFDAARQSVAEAYAQRNSERIDSVASSLRGLRTHFDITWVERIVDVRYDIGDSAADTVVAGLVRRSTNDNNNSSGFWFTLSDEDGAYFMGRKEATGCDDPCFEGNPRAFVALKGPGRTDVVRLREFTDYLPPVERSGNQ